MREDAPAIPPGDAVDAIDESDVFVARRDREEPTDDVDTTVTLHVYGWHNVQPGPLAWTFPTLRAALSAVRTMKNAVQWSIVAGRDLTIEEARSSGAILIEQLGRT